ncbi:hypothetical protein FH609_014180 [Streptomyces sp. 3MP-14]|uniref:Uncharacterized protein n=1 Tax=Streptomyces mimosae TaxID=2586635 RepID=A0A5N6A7W4_9ACTN|nr:MULTISPECIES: hypothetical protein [Streptomyces]KAB8164342.1 hypothetical protein FH607_017070 [Streptomyces mimosae]KAB8176619.1 hypothetical protein FH609_014180 [Streptomyces sp. 3MP-14]
MSATQAGRRGAARRAGESAFGALLLGRLVASWLLAAALVLGGAYAAWDTTRDTFGLGDTEKGEVTLLRCEQRDCTGIFAPSGDTVVLEQRIARVEGESLTVVRPLDGDLVFRADAAGRLYALAPLSGALLLAAVVIGGGLRRYRLAWIVAGTALAHLLLTFLLWI